MTGKAGERARGGRVAVAPAKSGGVRTATTSSRSTSNSSSNSACPNSPATRRHGLIHGQRLRCSTQAMEYL